MYKGDVNGATEPTQVAWGAVYATALSIAALMMSELLPIALLTPIATDLRVSVGTAGQAITVTAIATLIAGLSAPTLAAGRDRRRVLLAALVLVVTSNVIVALCSNLAVLFAGRVLVGFAHGTLWALVPATAMRLAPADQVPKALSVIFGGVSVAVLLAGPLGTYMGAELGWRSTFLVAAGIAGTALVWQWVHLPAMPTSGHASPRVLIELLAMPHFSLGLAGVVLAFAGHYAFFTYVRPFLELVAGIPIGEIGGILLGYGLASLLVILFVAGPLLRWRLRSTLVTVPFTLAVLAVGLFLLGRTPIIAGALVIAWGLLYGLLPVGWNVWVTRAVPYAPESAGGLMISAIQLGIAGGAGIGGFTVDHWGRHETAGLSAIILLSAGAAVSLSLWRWKGAGSLPPALVRGNSGS